MSPDLARVLTEGHQHRLPESNNFGGRRVLLASLPASWPPPYELSSLQLLAYEVREKFGAGMLPKPNVFWGGLWPSPLTGSTLLQNQTTQKTWQNNRSVQLTNQTESEPAAKIHPSRFGPCPSKSGAVFLRPTPLPAWCPPGSIRKDRDRRQQKQYSRPIVISRK